MARIPKASDALTKFKLTLSPDTDLVEAIEGVVRKRSLGAPVIDERGAVVGVLTEKDCLRLVARRNYRDLNGERVADHMSTLKGALSREMDLFTAAKTFLGGNFPVLPMVEQGKLVGRIGRWGLLRQIQRLEKAISHERRRQEQDLVHSERPTSIESMQRIAAAHRRDHVK